MKCEICGKDILKDSQCIDYKYYHNDCIINLTKENQKYKEAINKAIEILKLCNSKCSKEAIEILKGDKEWVMKKNIDIV